jgi:hypothetical protein
MGQLITDIAYMVIGIGIMSMVLIVGIVGIVKVWMDTNKIKDTKD